MAQDQATYPSEDDGKSGSGWPPLAWIRTRWRSLNRLRSGIGLRLLASVLLFSSAITLLLTLLELYLDYRRDVGTIEQRMSAIERSYLPSLGEGLWNLDARQLELQVDGILHLPAIRFVEVREATDRPDPMVVTAGSHQSSAAVHREFALFHRVHGAEQRLGVLSIEATLDEVYRELLDRGTVILVSQGAKTFVVSFFILFIVHRLITRHLAAIAGFLSGYDLRRSPPPLRLERPPPQRADELDQLVGEFNGMSASLQTAYGELRDSEQRFRDYTEMASDWLWATDREHRFTFFSEHSGAFGYDWGKLIGKRRWEVAADFASDPEKWREHIAILERREPFRDLVYENRRTDGSPLIISVSGKPAFDADGLFSGYHGVASDVTPIMRAQRAEASLLTVQAELARISRVTTLGQITASIAHEIAQPIGSARNNARAALNFLCRQPPDLGEVREALGCIVGDADRARDIIDRIRDHIKKAPPRKHRFDLNEAINEALALARSAITENGVLVRTRLAERLFPVLGDRVQLQQVVLNLILNAAEAMGSVDAGARELLIRTEQHRTEVLVAVCDSGPGVDPGHRERIFEAFYTTKSSGTGMGLSICRSIIDAHGGRLWAEANEPRGAVFQFTLPSAQGNS